jgi:hypothetical protein
MLLALIGLKSEKDVIGQKSFEPVTISQSGL